MRKPNLAVIMLLALTMSCATYSEMTKRGKFEDTARIYEVSIRWSEFNVAASFIKNQQEEKDLQQKLSAMERIKVTDYVVLKLVASADESEIVQIVKISYYKTDDVVVNSIRDQQIWEWDPSQKGWFLKSGLPDFQ